MPDEFSHLKSQIRGTIFTPADSGYNAELAGFITNVTHTPDLVVGVESAADVVAAVRYAGEHNYPVSILSTGHGTRLRIQSGLVITTKRLNTVKIDPETKIATIGAGARWAAVVQAAGPYGLAPITGSSPDVGVVGFSLGGGLGPLARSHGFASDYLEGFSVVTGTGELVQATADENPDMFWALRGGKYGLGVITEMRVRLVELSTLYAGSLFFAAEHIEPALRSWLDWTQHADDKVTTSAAILRFPPFEFIPGPLRGKTLLSVRFAYPGDETRGAELAAPLRALAPVYLDNLAQMPAANIGHIHNDPTEPGPGWERGMMLDHADQELASIVLAHFGAKVETPFVAFELRHMGDATAHDVPPGSAVGGRNARFTVFVISPILELFESVVPAAFTRLRDDLRPWLAPITNINFMGEPDSAQQYATAWSPITFNKLEKVRRQYDPAQLFARNFPTHPS